MAGGGDYTIAYYADAEHRMRLFDIDGAGDRISTRYAPGYFQLNRDFAWYGMVPRDCGGAEVTRPPQRRR